MTTNKKILTTKNLEIKSQNSLQEQEELQPSGLYHLAYILVPFKISIIVPAIKSQIRARLGQAFKILNYVKHSTFHQLGPTGPSWS